MGTRPSCDHRLLVPLPGCHALRSPSDSVPGVKRTASPTLTDTCFFQATLDVAEPAKGSHLKRKVLKNYMNCDGW